MTILDTPGSAGRLYERVQRVVPPIEWPAFEADIDAILRLKRERDAIILAHNYQTPEIFHCVADMVGDSLMLAREAAKGEARVIVMAGVHFMAETAKLLNPSKTVLIPDADGRLLARRVDHADDVRLLRAALSGRAGRHLRQHFGGGEGRLGHLLHVGQCGECRRVARRAARDHDSRRIPRQERRGADQGRDHRLARALRGA